MKVKCIKNYLGDLLIRNQKQINNPIKFEHSSLNDFVEFHLMIKPPREFVKGWDKISHLDFSEDELTFYDEDKEISINNNDIYYYEIVENNFVINFHCMGKYFLFLFQLKNKAPEEMFKDKIYKANFQTRQSIEETFECFIYSNQDIIEKKVEIDFDKRVMKIKVEINRKYIPLQSISQINLIQSNSVTDFDLLTGKNEYMNINCLTRVDKIHLIKIIKFFNKDLVYVNFDEQKKRLTESDLGNKYFTGYIFSNNKIRNDENKGKQLHSFIFEENELVAIPLEKTFFRKGKVRKFDYRNIINILENDLSGLVEITLKKPPSKCSSLRYGFKIPREKNRFINICYQNSQLKMNHRIKY